MKAFIKTYGCQMNVQDSLQMKGLLSRIGYGEAEEPLEADLILLVTCSIREKAVHKVYSELGRLRDLADNNPNLIVGVAGCVAQQEKSNLFKRYPFLDLVFGPDAINELPEMIHSVKEAKEKKNPLPILRTRFHSRKDFEFVNLINKEEENRSKAFVTIQKGCDNVCSFCIVPAVRGAEVSRPHREIVEEIKQLVDLGVKEVTLLGQNVNSYGLKHKEEITFAQLIDKIAAQTDIKRLRFVSSHPQDVGDDLIEKFRDIPILSPHFHLPVQSGSNRILTLMRRHYTREDYLHIVESLKKVREEIVFSTDLIVGFPGETEDDFEQTISLMEEVGFDASFSFVYSPRPHTTAVKLKEDVSSKEKAGRLAVLQHFQDRIALRRHKKLEGTIQEVLVEKEDDLGHNLVGRTGTNIITHFAKPKSPIFYEHNDLVGSFLQVRIGKASSYSLEGEVVNGIGFNDQNEGDRAHY